MNNRDCPHGRQIGKCADCEVLTLEARVLLLEQALGQAVEALESMKHYAEVSEPGLVVGIPALAIARQTLGGDA